MRLLFEGRFYMRVAFIGDFTVCEKWLLREKDETCRVSMNTYAFLLRLFSMALSRAVDERFRFPVRCCHTHTRPERSGYCEIRRDLPRIQEYTSDYSIHHHKMCLRVASFPWRFTVLYRERFRLIKGCYTQI